MSALSSAHEAAVRIAMWSGPRNISTAMMRAFENRPDTAVWDEPYYAAYLAATGLDHPMRAEILRAHESNPEKIAALLRGPVPEGREVFYQKHMTHHMLPTFDLSWLSEVRHAFLIRRPENVLMSYALKRETVTLADIGALQQRDLFERVADRLGHAPPVVDSTAVLANPRRTLSRLCAALLLPFREEMLSWPAGRRASDGAWAPHWYQAVEASTGFQPPRPDVPREKLPLALARLAEAATPAYEQLARHAL